MFFLRIVAIAIAFIVLAGPTPSDAQRRSLEKEAQASAFRKEFRKRKMREGDSRRGSDNPRNTWLGIVDQYRRAIDGGRLSEAEKLASRALAFATNKWGREHKTVGRATFMEAKALYSLGRVRESEQKARRALVMIEHREGKKSEAVVWSLTVLGLSLVDQGRLEEAEPVVERVLALSVRSSNAEGRVQVQNLHTYLLQEQGKWEQGAKIARDALAAAERLKSKRLSAVMNFRLGVLMDRTGRDAESEIHLKRAVSLEESLGATHPLIGISMRNLAHLLARMGRLGEAETLAKRSVALLEQILPDESRQLLLSRTALAMVLVAQKRYAEAEQMLRSVLTVRENRAGIAPSDIAYTLAALGFVRMQQDNLDDADRLLMRALEINRTDVGERGLRTAMTKLLLGRSYLQRGSVSIAGPLLQQAFATRLQRLGSSNPDTIAAQYHLGTFLLAAGRPAEAFKAFAQVLDESTRRSAATVGSDEQHVEEVLFSVAGRDSAELLSQAAWQLGQQSGSDQQQTGAEAFVRLQMAVEPRAGRAILNMAARLATGNAEIAQLLRKRRDLTALWQSADARVTRLLTDNAEAAERRNLRGEINGYRTELEATDRRLAADFPNLAALLQPAPLNIGGVQSLLSADEAALVYRTGKAATFAWVITRDSWAWYRIETGRDQLASHVARLRDALDHDEPRTAKAEDLYDLNLAHQLYLALLGPLEQHIKGKSHLVVVPDGPLTSLPFAALVTQPSRDAQPITTAYRNASWLINDRSVSILPSITSLKALRATARGMPAREPLVGFGDPIITASTAGAPPDGSARRRSSRQAYATLSSAGTVDLVSLRRGLESLPETRRELNEVAATLRASTSILHFGTNASEAVVRKLDLSKYRVVYFATHGLVAGEVGGLDEPALVLTLPKVQSLQDDGLLTASEVATLKLNADWVVLSACNTAAGDKPGAEALSGLARAFFYAGTRSILVSHWRIDSDAATRLATSMFAFLRDEPQLGGAEALRHAMRAYVADRSDPWNAYPGRWAAFAVVGEGHER